MCSLSALNLETAHVHRTFEGDAKIRPVNIPGFILIDFFQIVLSSYTAYNVVPAVGEANCNDSASKNKGANETKG